MALFSDVTRDDGRHPERVEGLVGQRAQWRPRFCCRGRGHCSVSRMPDISLSYDYSSESG